LEIERKPPKVQYFQRFPRLKNFSGVLTFAVFFEPGGVWGHREDSHGFDSPLLRSQVIVEEEKESKIGFEDAGVLDVSDSFGGDPSVSEKARGRSVADNYDTSEVVKLFLNIDFPFVVLSTVGSHPFDVIQVVFELRLVVRH